MKLHYGFDHIKKRCHPGDILAVRRPAARVRSFEQTLMPKRLVSKQLVEDISDPCVRDALLGIHHGSLQECSLDFGGMNFATSDPDPCRKHDNPLSMFFRVSLQNPMAVKGQASDNKVDWIIGEVVIVELQVLLKCQSDVFVWTEPSDADASLQLLAPGDALVDGLIGFRRDEEKYFFLLELVDLPDAIKIEALRSLKHLMDIAAFAASGNVLSLVNEEAAEQRNVLRILAERRVVDCVADSDAVSEWCLASGVQERLEPVTRCYQAHLACTAQLTLPINDMSVLDLAGLLKSRGWKHQFWDRCQSTSRVPPVNVIGRRPKVWWTYAGKGDGIVNIWYLKVLASVDSLTCTEVPHFESERFYRELLSGKQRKARGMQMISDVGFEFDDFADSEAKRHRSDGHDAGTAGGKGKKHTHSTSDKTHTWGAALLTYSVRKSTGIARYQATCHLVCRHKNLLGKKTPCTRSLDIKGEFTEDIVLRHLRDWICHAKDPSAPTKYSAHLVFYHVDSCKRRGYATHLFGEVVKTYLTF
jgi:hypothetical protein